MHRIVVLLIVAATSLTVTAQTAIPTREGRGGQPGQGGGQGRRGGGPGPELNLPVFDHDEITAMLPGLCHGKTSIEELRKLPIAGILSGFLTAEQTAYMSSWSEGT